MSEEKKKICRICKESKRLTEFGLMMQGPDGKLAYCKACGRDYYNEHAKKKRGSKPKKEEPKHNPTEIPEGWLPFKSRKSDDILKHFAVRGEM